MGIRDDRLRAELNNFVVEFRSQVVKWEIIGTNNPPDRIKFFYNLKSLVGFNEHKMPIYHTGFEVEISFPPEYPRINPAVSLTGKKPWPIHPNIWADGRFCLDGTQHWVPGIGVSLVSICQMVGQIISYQHVYLRSPAYVNIELTDWIKENLNFENNGATTKNPIDSSIIWLPETSPSDSIVFGE